MRSQRWAWTHRYAVPMFVASVISVTLAGSALFAVIALGNGETTDPQNPDVDPCMVGSWREVSSIQQLTGGLGTLVLTGEGPVFEFRDEGDGVAEFGPDVGSATVYRTESLGETVDAKVWGAVRYRFVARDGALQFSDLRSDARFQMDALGVPLEEQYEMAPGPLSYQCDGDALAVSSDGYQAEYQRLGSP